MIATRLMGGLGNQMFQYALGRNLSLTNNTKLIIDLTHLEHQPEGEVARDYELGCFDIQGRLIHYPAENYKALFRRVNPAIIEEKGLGYDPSILKVRNNALLVGYWQSEKYFNDIESQLRHDFSFIKPLSKKKQPVYRQIVGTKSSISLQIRRGDYVNHPSSMKFHGLMPLEYYDKAAKIIAKEIHNPHFFIISDDPAWCKKNLKLPYAMTFVDHVPGTGQEDMRLMSLCSHHIIANSSFGWWGAWLSANKNKIVIAPKKWFLEEKSHLSDRLPKDWIKI